MMKALALAAAAIVLSAPALAQQTKTPLATPEKVHDDFAMIDGDKNGTLSLAEVKLADITVT